MTVLQTIDLEETDTMVVHLEVLVEDIPVEGNVLCSDDDEENEAAEAAVHAEWDHNDFSWCRFRVVAKLAGSPEIYGEDQLGGISILEKYLPEGRTLEDEARQMVIDYDMIAAAKEQLGLAVAGVEASIREFHEGGV